MWLCVCILVCIYSLSHTYTTYNILSKYVIAEKFQGWAQNITRKHKRNKVADFEKSEKYFWLDFY